MNLLDKRYTETRTRDFTYRASPIYDDILPEVTSEFEYTGEFRPAKQGEWYMSDLRCPQHADRDIHSALPRLILRKREPKVRYVEIERRYKEEWLQAGEWVQIYSEIFQVDKAFKLMNTCRAIIFRREEFYD